jgi:hypothetical protein
MEHLREMKLVTGKEDDIEMELPKSLIKQF